MPILIILYTIPAFLIVLGIVKIIRSFFTSSKDTDYFGGGAYIFAAVFWIFSAVFIIGTPNEFLKEKADKEVRDNEIIKNCNFFFLLLSTFTSCAIAVIRVAIARMI